VYEVQRRDTLWRIAECHLGDPLRWREIYELNRGLPQADGRTLTDPDTIRPGWALRLPADATGLPSASPHPSASRARPGPTQPPPTDGHAGADAVPSDRRDRSATPDTGHPEDGMVLVDDDLVPAHATPGGPTADDLVASGPPRPASPTGGTPPPSGADGGDDLVATRDAAPASPPTPPPLPPPTGPETGDGMVLLPDDLVTGDGASTTDDDWMVARGDDRRR
jgi:hypothetical protein